MIASGKIISFGPNCVPNSNCVSGPVASTLAGITVIVTGVYVGTLAVELSNDNGAAWTQIDTISNEQITTTYQFPAATTFQTGSITNVRVRGSSWASGTALVEINPVFAGQSVSVANFPASQTVDGTVSTNQGQVTDIYAVVAQITAEDVTSTVTPIANGAFFVTGIPTPGSTASFVLASGYSTMTILVTGTWTGVLECEVSSDNGVTWCQTTLHQIGTEGEIHSFTANIIGQGVSTGFTNLRVRAIAVWTGMASIRLVQSINPGTIYTLDAIRIQDPVVPQQQAAVKGPSTAAAAIDGALVVAVSPNNIPVPPASLPLPANAAEETGGNLASINTKTPPLGQALASASTPAVLPVAQQTALTPPTAAAIGTAVAGSLANPLPVTVTDTPLPIAVTGTPIAVDFLTPQHIFLDDAAGGNPANTVAKNVQAARSLQVQRIQDSGRTLVVLLVDALQPTSTEALMTMTINKGGTVTSGTGYTITAGKTLHIQSVLFAPEALSGSGLFRMRLRNDPATVSASSPVVWGAGVNDNSANTSFALANPIPDGLELAGGTQVGISMIVTGTNSSTCTACVVAYEY